jgi:hypothetical protein
MEAVTFNVRNHSRDPGYDGVTECLGILFLAAQSQTLPNNLFYTKNITSLHTLYNLQLFEDVSLE